MLVLILGCLSFQTSMEAGISYPTTSLQWGDDHTCLNEDQPEIAKELVLGSSKTVVVAGGERPVPDSEWSDFSPGFLNQKNSLRNLQFDSSCLTRSPNRSADCSGEECASFVEIQAYTWLELSQIVAVDCIPAGSNCSPMSVQEKELVVVVIKKCHQLTFIGTQYFLSGPSGERAVLHATEGDRDPDINVPLPQGWSLSKEELSEPFVLYPFGRGDDCYYNIIRDSLGQSYHQFEYAKGVYP